VKAMRQWKLADAKNRLTELVNLALAEGPQQIHRREDVVVVLAQRHYERLTGKRPSFQEFLLSGPGFEGLDLKRDRSLMRDVDL
jgi:antitoxin Phd_YefM of type II toxin-antitoxin system